MLSREYIAGFVDGEAYLGLIKKSCKTVTLGYIYKPVIKIAQTKKQDRILYLLKDKYGGCLSKTRKHTNPNQNDSAMWEVFNRPMVKKILEEIYPYLIVKKPQAKLLIEFVELGNSLTKKDSESLKKKERILNERTRIFNELRLLNKRGLAETE